MEVWVLGDVCRWWWCTASAVRRRGPRFTRPQVLGVDDPIVNISSWGACEVGWEGQAHGVRQGPCWGVFGVMTGPFRGVPPCPLLEARRGPPKPDVRSGGEPLPRVPCDVGAGGAVEQVVQALAGETIAGEQGGGGQVVGSFVSEDVHPPLLKVAPVLSLATNKATQRLSDACLASLNHNRATPHQHIRQHRRDQPRRAQIAQQQPKAIMRWRSTPKPQRRIHRPKTQRHRRTPPSHITPISPRHQPARSSPPRRRSRPPTAPPPHQSAVQTPPQCDVGTRPRG